MAALRTFSSEAEPEVLDELQEIAAREGRQFQAVLGDAMREYLARRRALTSRPNVFEALDASLETRDELYRSLAK